MLLSPDEKEEDLQYEGLKIIQNKSEYRFTTDAVLLANFVRNAKGKTVVELGAGCGVISILICKKQQPKRLVAVEIQEVMYDLLRRNVLLNGLDIQTVHADMKDASRFVKDADIVVCNPPYRPLNGGEKQLKDSVRNCRHEVLIDLDGVVRSASDVLKFGGSLYLVHQAERFADVACKMRDNGIELKEVALVKAFAGELPKIALFKGVKGGKVGLKWLDDLIVFDPNGVYTPTVKRLYGGE